MKQKDIALIAAIAVFAGIVSLLLSSHIFVGGGKSQSVEDVKPISTSFQTPNTKYFNSNSIDPTQNIQIGASNNPAPFSAGQ